MNTISSLAGILLSLLPVFTQPSGMLFVNLTVGWILCPMRRTVTAMLGFGDPEGKHSHDAYHRLLREGAWVCAELFQRWAAWVIAEHCARGKVILQTDDTVHKKTGRKVDGAKYCRDAVRSTGAKVVFAWGLQFVPLCVRIIPPWGGEPISIPINVRLYRKGGPSLLDLVEEMVTELAEWLPTRDFCLVGDGFYASLAGRALPRTQIISRIRHDAALYDMPPTRKANARGRRPKKGPRLPTPAQLASRARRWTLVETVERGQDRKRLVHTQRVLWYKVGKDQPFLLVISRDPEGKEKDDFFFTTDLDMAPADVISEFANRWAIEDTFRNAKQYLGAEEPQTWCGEGPERVGALAYLLYGVVWLWYLKHAHGNVPLPSRPWYASKAMPSFRDALAALRRTLWLHRFSQPVLTRAQMQENQITLVEALAYAA